MKPKRPIKEKFNAIMLEQFTSDNSWEWYEITFDVTPKEAVISWLVDELEYTPEEAEKSIETDQESYCQAESVRAFIITI